MSMLSLQIQSTEVYMVYVYLHYIPLFGRLTIAGKTSPLQELSLYSQQSHFGALCLLINTQLI